MSTTTTRIPPRCPECGVPMSIEVRHGVTLYECHEKNCSVIRVRFLDIVYDSTGNKEEVQRRLL